MIRSRALAVVMATTLAASACRSTPGTADSSPAAPAVKAPDGQALKPVTLPDLSKMVPSAQQQITAQHEALMKTVTAPGARPADMARAYGEMGKLLLAAQYGEPAEAAFSNAQALDPGDYRWPYYLAQHYRAQGDPAKTRDALARVIQLKSDHVPSLVWLGDTYLTLGDPLAASSNFLTAMAIDNSVAAAHAGLGRAALANNDPKQAIAQLEQALAIDPQAVGAHYPLSLAYNAIGDTANADRHLKLRQERPVTPPDPLMAELDTLLESPQRYETQGIRALTRQDWPAAAAEFRKGLALDPGSAALKHRLATALNMMGEKEEAESIFATVARESPDYFPTRFSLGVIRQSQRRDAEAVEHFNAALAQRADYAEARLRLASSLRRLGRTDEAVAQYEQVITLNPDQSEALVGQAMALAAGRRYTQARDALLAALKTHPGDSALTHAMARLMATAPDDEVRDGRLAYGLVQQLLAQGRRPDLGETLAMSLAAVGEYDRAAALQRDLIRAAGQAGVQPPARLRANLALYEARRPCQTPWTEEEMP